MDRTVMLIIGGFLLGISASIMWSRIKTACANATSIPNSYYGNSGVWGTHMDVKSATRVFGYTMDMIDNGKWNQSIVSLWRRNTTHDFFMMVTSETQKPQKTYLSADAAKRLVRDKAAYEEAEKIIHDWFDTHKVSN